MRHVRTRQEGVARFVGDVEEAHGLAKNMVAVEYDDPVPETDTMADMHDGSYRGVSYFNGKHAGEPTKRGAWGRRRVESNWLGTVGCQHHAEAKRAYCSRCVAHRGELKCY